jgi:hypothetical protein
MVAAALGDMGYEADASEVASALADDGFYSEAVSGRPAAAAEQEQDAADADFEMQPEDGEYPYAYADQGAEAEAEAADAPPEEQEQEPEPEQYADAEAGDAEDAQAQAQEGDYEESDVLPAGDDEAMGYEQEPDDYFMYDAPPLLDEQEGEGQEVPGDNGDDGAEAENLDAEAQELAPQDFEEEERGEDGNGYITTETGAHGLEPFDGAEGETEPAVVEEAAAAADAVPTEESESAADAPPSEAEQTALLDAIEDAVQAASSNAERKALVQALGHPPIDLSGDAAAKANRTREAVGDACDAALKRGVPVSALTRALHGSGLFSAVKNGIKKGVQVVAKVAKPVLGVASMVPGKVGMAARAANGAMNVMGIGGEPDDHAAAAQQQGGALLQRVAHAILHRGGAIATGTPDAGGGALGLAGGSRRSGYMAKLAATQQLRYDKLHLTRTSKELMKLAMAQTAQRRLNGEHDAYDGAPAAASRNVNVAPAEAPSYLPGNLRKAWSRFDDDKKLAVIAHYKKGGDKGSALWHATLRHILSRPDSDSGSGLCGGGFSRGDNVLYKGPPAPWVPEDGVVVVVKQTPKGVLVENPDSGDRATVPAEQLEAMDDDEFEEPGPPPPPPRAAAPAPAAAAAAAAAAPPRRDAGKPPLLVHPSRRVHGRVIPMRRALDAPYADRIPGIAMAGQKRGRS